MRIQQPMGQQQMPMGQQQQPQMGQRPFDDQSFDYM